MKFLKTISDLQKRFEPESSPIHTALVTARNAPAHEACCTYFACMGCTYWMKPLLGGISKQVLKSFLNLISSLMIKKCMCGFCKQCST